MIRYNSVERWSIPTNCCQVASEWDAMIAELIYTSALKTLDGSGYGVVAKSENLPAHLESFMRQLNRYDYKLSAQPGVTAFSPVVFSHTTFRDDATTWHVLSRSGPGGYDQTQRAVYLVHHVALTRDQLGTARVADLIQEPSLFQAEWDGHVGGIPARLLPAPSRRGQTHDARELGAVHPEWAKAWRELLDQQEGLASFLIVPAEADVLALFAEALAPLPPKVAEEVTFITHMIADRPGVHFDWIGIPAGSELARSIPHRFPDRTLDLTKPLPSVVRTPAPKEREAVARVRPERSAAIRQPVTRARDEQDLDDIRKDEVRRPRENQSAAQRPPPSVVPPPPPPPESLFRRHAVSAVTIAVFALISFAAYVGRPGRKSDRGAEPPRKPPVVYHSNGWLSDILRNEESQNWVEVPVEGLQIPQPRGVKLRLLSGKGLEPATSSPPDGSGDSGIEVYLPGPGPDQQGKDESVELRVKDGKIELKRRSIPTVELIDRLQLSILEIDPLLESEASVRILFTPVLPPVPLSDAKIEPFESADANAFFKAIHASKNLDARVRVHRVSLSILPPGNAGWQVTKEAEAPFGKELNVALPINLPDSRWSLTINVGPYVDIGRFPGPRAIRAELMDPPSGAGAKRRANADNNGGQAPEQHTSSSGGSKVAEDRDLLLRLFRRFGRVHGAIAIKVNNGESDELVDLLRFGDAS